MYHPQDLVITNLQVDLDIHSQEVDLEDHHINNLEVELDTTSLLVNLAGHLTVAQ